jgi:hypothetical protein
MVEIAGAHSTMFSATNSESTAAALTRSLVARSLHYLERIPVVGSSSDFRAGR